MTVDMETRAEGRRDGGVRFAEPREITSPEGACFYHTVDVPGHGHFAGGWDLREGIHDYLGGLDFRGKRVLDVGTASGFLTFTMERLGAEVVSYDLAPGDSWDVVPFAGTDRDPTDALVKRIVEDLNRAYWFCHGAFGSKARLAQGTVYDIPEALGPVDVSMFGSILLHLRDPFRALHGAARITKETLVVSDLMPPRYRFLRWLPDRIGLPMMFVPRQSAPQTFETWWILSPKVVREFLRILGFGRTTITYRTYPLQGKPRICFTVVGHRTEARTERL